MSLQRYFARLEPEEQGQYWIVQEVIDFNPLGCFHPSMIWVECTAEVDQEWTYNEKTCMFTSPDGSVTVDMPLTTDSRVAVLETDVKKTGDVASLVFVELAQTGTFDDTTIMEHAEQFLPWAWPVAYKESVIVRYGETDSLYQCVQAHTSQQDWPPSATPALWRPVGNPSDEWPGWSQPIGAFDAYGQGAKVAHNGKRWVSDVGGNVWEPGVYGWTEAV